MKLSKILLIVGLYILNYNPKVLAQDYISQDQKILIYDPNGVSGSFQYSFSQLSNDSVFVADTIDENIDNFEALFIFIGYPYILSQDEGNSLIGFLNLNKPIYLFSDLDSQSILSVSFWNFIGLTNYAIFPIQVPVTSVVGVDSLFTENIIIDTSFSSSIPGLEGNIAHVLVGISDSSMSLATTYISTNGTINVILDLYNLIHHRVFLKRVIEHFDLNLKPPLIQFSPPVDTAYILGGCTTPEIISHNLISTPNRDSISIEPGFNTSFMYYDSLGYPVYVENYYFIAIDSSDEFEYELWFHPKSYPPFDPVLILFDSTFYIDQNDFDIQLIAKRNGIPVDSYTQPFRADFGLDVEDDGTLPEVFSLLQNYPNPFNPTTTIKFTIPTSPLNPSPYQGEGQWERLITLKVYDVLGNEIATLVNEEKPAGSYEVEFNAANLASGIYFYQLKIGSFIETKKMVILK